MIESTRIKLRALKVTDIQDLYNYRSDAETNKYQSWIPENLEDVEKFIKSIPNQFNVEDTWFQLGIIEKDSNQLIGDIGVHFKDDQQIELGITLHKEKQKKGFATEAMKAVIDYLFQELNKHRIVTSIDPENTNSLNLMKRLGFRKEGYFKESIYFKGEWVDDVVFAILKKEWCQNLD